MNTENLQTQGNTITFNYVVRKATLKQRFAKWLRAHTALFTKLFYMMLGVAIYATIQLIVSII